MEVDLPGYYTRTGLITWLFRVHYTGARKCRDQLRAESFKKPPGSSSSRLDSPKAWGLQQRCLL